VNAGRDVERLIAGWLVEEAAPGAPDRVLESTRQVVRRTNQRRFAALWREPMLTPARLAAMAAVLAIAVGAGFWIGRTTIVSGPGAPAASPTPAPTPEITVATYGAARNSVCAKYRAIVDPLKPVLDRLYEPALPAADRAAKAQTLADIGTQLDRMTDELEALAPPASAAVDHQTMVANYRQVVSLINQAVASIGAGNLVGAEALDLATDPLTRDIEAFESKYGLAACP
jgi:hypothetical protein